MKVSPLDIEQMKFHVVFRGYNRGEVDSFLDSIAQEMEEIIRELTELRELRDSYEQRRQELTNQEETIKNTMLTTQKLMEEIKENARKEADLIVKDAEIRSQQIINNVQQEKAAMEADLANLKRRRHHFLEDMKKVIQMHLEMVHFEEQAGEKVKDDVAAQ